MEELEAMLVPNVDWKRAVVYWLVVWLGIGFGYIVNRIHKHFNRK